MTKLNENGQFVFSTYLGGRGEELGTLTMDVAGNCFIVGMTSSTNFPVMSPVQAAFGGGGGSLYLGDIRDQNEFQRPVCVLHVSWRNQQ